MLCKRLIQRVLVLMLLIKVTYVEKFWIFPPKSLEKIRAPKIRMRQFLKKKIEDDI